MTPLQRCLLAGLIAAVATAAYAQLLSVPEMSVAAVIAKR